MTSAPKDYILSEYDRLLSAERYYVRLIEEYKKRIKQLEQELEAK